MKKKMIASMLALLLLALCACGAAQSFEVSLEGNATTGYLWQIGECDEHLVIEEQEYELKEAEEGMAGVGGYSKFTVTTAENTPAGTYEATFLYYRPWEEADTAIQKVVYTVTVNPDGTQTGSQSEIISLQ